MELRKYNAKERSIKNYQMEKYLIETPEGTDDVVHICDIIIPPDFKKTRIHIDKIKKAIKYYVRNGMFDKPISVIPITNEQGFHNKYLLVDEYSRYYAADEYMDVRYIPIRYVDINTYCKERNI